MTANSRTQQAIEGALRDGLLINLRPSFDIVRDIEVTRDLVERDATSTLAAVVLSVLEVEGDRPDFMLLEPSEQFRAVQHSLFEHLYRAGHMTGEESACSYVEAGCFEYGVVHIALHDGGSLEAWLIVDPVSGTVVRH
jgi:hypothetical protein